MHPLYPVDNIFYLIFDIKGDFRVISSVNLKDEDIKLLEQFMKDNNIKNKSLAIRECIKVATKKEDINDFLFEQNNKMNRIIHNVYLIKKLLEQFFVNTGFAKNIDLESDDCLNEFYEKNNSFKNNFLG